MPIASGTRLGPYEIISSVGAGGMGEVYRAKDTRLDRVVAVKVLPPELANDPQKRQRFEREARSISTLSHPHICTLHDIGHQDGVDYLVLLPATTTDVNNLRLCPRCGGPMVVIERLTAAELQLRSPPLTAVA
jgi:serine/threonine protein kinase